MLTAWNLLDRGCWPPPMPFALNFHDKINLLVNTYTKVDTYNQIIYYIILLPHTGLEKNNLY